MLFMPKCAKIVKLSKTIWSYNILNVQDLCLQKFLEVKSRCKLVNLFYCTFYQKSFFAINT